MWGKKLSHVVFCCGEYAASRGIMNPTRKGQNEVGSGAHISRKQSRTGCFATADRKEYT